MKKEKIKKVTLYEIELTLDEYLLDRLELIGMRRISQDRHALIEYAVNSLLKDKISK